MSIKPLPPEVIAQIKSSITITSLNGVICELIKNSLDASSTKIEINVDYAKGGCIAEDDGLGIHPSEFGEDGGLGKLYHTSKLNTLVHGGRGTFLASLSAMALMSITSHHHLHRSNNTITLHKSEVISRQTPAPQHLSSHGTRVTIRDLFGNMPVRVKQRAIAAEQRNHKDWEELRRDVVILLISWPRHVAVTVREVDSNQKFTIRPHALEDDSDTGVNISRICSILTQVGFISPEKSWVPVGISTSSLKIHGTFSLQPSAVKQVQFISSGNSPLEGQSTLHAEINRLFVNSSFGEVEGSDLDDAQTRRTKDDRSMYTNKELMGGKKSVERWPMFYINIQPNSSAMASRMDPGILDSGSRLSSIIELLQVMVTKFLTVHHFRPKSGRAQRSKQQDHAGLRESPAKAKSTNAKRAARQIERSSLDDRRSFDSLGTNVKLPSFRASNTQSPFEGWSKIKSGGILHPKHHADESDRGTFAKLTPATRGKAIDPLVESLTESSRSPLIAKNGKLLRKPFDDAILASHSKPIQTPDRSASPVTQTTAGSQDNMEWVNPINKVRSVINRRTGMTVHTQDELRSARLSQNVSLSRSSITSNTKPSTWIQEVLQKWDNPVFSTVQTSIPQVLLERSDEHTQSILHGRHLCSQVDIDRAFTESSGVIGRISKDALRNAEIISQVDRKFILIKVQTALDNTLLLVDQHAADERIRIESLMEELCTPSDDSQLESPILTTLLSTPLIFEISVKEFQVLKAQHSFFANWGIVYDVAWNLKTNSSSKNPLCRLSIRALPPGIIERCRQEPRLLIQLIRTEAWKAHEMGKPIPDLSLVQTWLQRTQHCPQGLLDILNSRACRGAIMFNDELSNAQCEKLVMNLADCKFPFQCAHGRPSLVPLVDTNTLKVLDYGASASLSATGSGSFGETFRKWKQKTLSD